MKYRIRFEVFSHIINPPPPSLDVASFSPRGRDEYLIRLLSPRGRRMNRGPCQLIRSVRGGRDRVKKLWKTPLREPYFVHVPPPSFSFFSFLFSPSLRLHVARDVSTYKYARCRGDKATGCPRAARLLL